MASEDRRQIRISLDQRPEGVVATVTISNAGRLNTMNSVLMGEFIEEMAALAANRELRVLILTGEGEKAFIGGADIKEMALIRDAAGARAFISRVHACCAAVRSIPVPIIARIQGFAFGAGLEMAAACDLRIASEDATFGMPEVKLGIPSVAEAALLPMLVGWGRTRQMLLLGENFDARQAYEWNFVERVTARDRLDDAVQSWVDQTLSSAPAAVRLQKSLIRSWEDLPLRAAVAAGINAFAAAYETDEPRSKMRHFLNAQAARKARK
jgi:enoyl-CoA hydratase/carnithine racemase